MTLIYYQSSGPDATECCDELDGKPGSDVDSVQSSSLECCRFFPGEWFRLRFTLNHRMKNFDITPTENQLSSALVNSKSILSFMLYYIINHMVISVSSALWRCWLGSRNGIRPVKTRVVGAGVVICLEQGADLHTAQLMPMPLTVSYFSKIQIGFTFLVPTHLSSSGKRAIKRVCVCVCVCLYN